MDEQHLLAFAAAAVLALVHLSGGALRFLEGVPRSGWLSAFAGISVAYVFVHLLPELASGQAAVEEDGEPLRFLEEHVYLMALLGLAIFYGVESHSLRSRLAQRDAGRQDRTAGGAFWLSMASFALYNAIVGYLLLRGELEEASELALFTLALAVHFVINDFGLREHHKDAYTRVGRWILAFAVLAGWLVGVVAGVPERAIALIIGFIAGGVILNVMKEEVPGERQARFLPFVVAAAAYAALLQAV
jgi:hypothetical protein